MKLLLSTLLLLGAAGTATAQQAKRIPNRAQDQDLCLQVNDGGTPGDGLCIDGPTKGVGIGTDAPTFGFVDKGLHIAGTTRGTLRIEGAGGSSEVFHETNLFVNNLSANDIVFRTNGTAERGRFTNSTGNLDLQGGITLNGGTDVLDAHRVAVYSSVSSTGTTGLSADITLARTGFVTCARFAISGTSTSSAGNMSFQTTGGTDGFAPTGSTGGSAVMSLGSPSTSEAVFVEARNSGGNIVFDFWRHGTSSSNPWPTSTNIASGHPGASQRPISFCYRN